MPIDGQSTPSPRFDGTNPNRSINSPSHPLTLSPSHPLTLSPSPLSSSATAKVKISNRLGMHARPAMVFVETACKFKADITVRRCDQNETVDGKSIMQLMMLAATH